MNTTLYKGLSEITRFFGAQLNFHTQKTVQCVAYLKYVNSAND